MAIALLGALLSLAPSARADNGAGGAVLFPVREPEEAAKAFASGKALYADQKYAEARAAFAEAVDKDPDVVQYLANLGTVELTLGRSRDAAEHLSRAIALLDDDPSVDPQKAEPLRKSREAAAREVGAFDIRVNVNGAWVFVDDRRVGLSPLRWKVYVDPGEHVMRATSSGYGSVTVGMELAKGETKVVSLTLSPHVGPTTPAPAPHPSDAPRSGAARYATIVAGSAAAVVGIGTGIAGTVASQTASRENAELGAVLDVDFPTHNGCVAPSGYRTVLCPALEASLESTGFWRNVAISGYSIGGAFTLGTVLTAILWPETDEGAPRAIVLPIWRSGFAGVEVGGAF